jgi:Tfp pilus assembly protein PilX
MALVLALFVLVVLGVMVTVTFFAGWLEQQIGENTLFSAQAAEAADGGLADALVTLTPANLSSLALGGAPIRLPALSFGTGATVERQVARLSETLFLVTARGFRRDATGGTLATRGAGLLLHLLADSVTGAQIVVPLRDRAWFQLY